MQTSQGPSPLQASFTINDDFNSSTGTLSFVAFEYNIPPEPSKLNTSLLVSPCKDNVESISVGVLDQFGFMALKEIPYSCGNSSQVEVSIVVN